MKRTAVQVSQDNCLNDSEQYSRRNSVRIYDIDDREQKESPHETSYKVAHVLTTKLGITVEIQDIDVTHRMGKFMKECNR